MIIMHRRSGSWELFDEQDVIAVYLTPADKAEIAHMEDTANVYMTFNPNRRYTETFLLDELRRAEALAVARSKKVKEERW